jgi:hypothetical protein
MAKQGGGRVAGGWPQRGQRGGQQGRSAGQLEISREGSGLRTLMCANCFSNRAISRLIPGGSSNASCASGVGGGRGGERGFSECGETG